MPNQKLSIIEKNINEIVYNFKNLYKIKYDILKAEKLIRSSIKKNKVIFCGNGGSASDALHASAELLGKYLKNRKALNAVCLNSNISAITAIANDYDYKKIFTRQLDGIGKSGDLLFAISTSGKSKNIIDVLKLAKKKKIRSILLTGNNKKKFDVDLTIRVPASRVDRIQELHITTLHIICELIEQNLK